MKKALFIPIFLFLFFIGISYSYVFQLVNNSDKKLVFQENTFGKISLFPHNITEVNDILYINLTNYNTDLALDVYSTEHPDFILRNIEQYVGNKWITINPVKSKAKFNGQSWIKWQGLQSYKNIKIQLRITTDVKINSTGKYDIFIKPTSLNIAQAKALGLYVLLDPWFDTTYEYCRNITMTNPSIDVRNNQVIQFSLIDSNVLQANGNDIRIVSNPCDQDGSLIAYELRDIDTNTNRYEIVFYDNFTSFETKTRSIYYGSTTAINAQSDLIDYWNFNDEIVPYIIDSGIWSAVGGNLSVTQVTQNIAHTTTDFFNGTAYFDIISEPGGGYALLSFVNSTNSGYRLRFPASGDNPPAMRIREKDEGADGAIIVTDPIYIGTDNVTYIRYDNSTLAWWKGVGLVNATHNSKYTSGGNFSIIMDRPGNSLDNITFYKNGYWRMDEDFGITLSDIQEQPHNPVIELVSVNDSILPYGDTVQFSANWYDNNTSPSVKLFACKTNIYSNGCTGGSYCSAGISASDPITCDYTTQLTDNGTNSAYLFVEDNSGLVSGSNLTQFTVISRPWINMTTLRTNVTEYNISNMILFNATWSDYLYPLDSYIFESNLTGTYINNTYTFQNINNSYSSLTKTIPITAEGHLVNWLIYANNTNNEFNSSQIQSFTVTNKTPVMTDIIIKSCVDTGTKVQYTFTTSDNGDIWKTDCYFESPSGEVSYIIPIEGSAGTGIKTCEKILNEIGQWNVNATIEDYANLTITKNSGVEVKSSGGCGGSGTIGGGGGGGGDSGNDIGTPCIKNTDCNPGLFCDFVTNTCQIKDSKISETIPIPINETGEGRLLTLISTRYKNMIPDTPFKKLLRLTVGKSPVIKNLNIAQTFILSFSILAITLYKKL